MSASVMTGFCRVTIVGPNTRIDLALPEDVPVAEIFPDILQMSGQAAGDAPHLGYGLARLGHEPLDPALSLASQQVRNGEILHLRSLAEKQPPVVYDDVVDAIATSVESSSALWNDRLLRATTLAASAALMLLSAYVLWRAGDQGAIHGLPAVLAGVMAIVLLSFGSARALVYEDHSTGAVICAGALPHAFLAGLGLLPIEPSLGGPSRAHFTVACVVLLVASVLGALLLPYYDAPFFATALASGIGTVAGLFATLFEHLPVVQVAAVTGTLALALIGFLPSLSARWAKVPDAFVLPDPALPEAERTDEEVNATLVREQTSRGHEVLVGLVGACVLSLVTSAALLGFDADPRTQVWSRTLAVVLAVCMLVRARIFRQAGEVLLLVGGGVLAFGLLQVGIVAGSSTFSRSTWVFAVTALVAVAFSVVAVTVPGRQLSPYWARVLEIAESLILISVVPLCVAVLELYDWVQMKVL